MNTPDRTHAFLSRLYSQAERERRKHNSKPPCAIVTLNEFELCELEGILVGMRETEILSDESAVKELIAGPIEQAARAIMGSRNGLLGE